MTTLNKTPYSVALHFNDVCADCAELNAAAEYVPDEVIDPWTEFAHLIEVDRDSPPEAIAAAAQSDDLLN